MSMAEDDEEDVSEGVGVDFPEAEENLVSPAGSTNGSFWKDTARIIDLGVAGVGLDPLATGGTGGTGSLTNLAKVVDESLCSSSLSSETSARDVDSSNGGADDGSRRDALSLGWKLDGSRLDTARKLLRFSNSGVLYKVGLAGERIEGLINFVLEAFSDLLSSFEFSSVI
jgi:hypothetical protein